MVHDHLDPIPRRKKEDEREEGKIFKIGNEEITNKKKWEYEEGDAIIWRNQ